VIEVTKSGLAEGRVDEESRKTSRGSGLFVGRRVTLTESTAESRRRWLRRR